MSEYLNAPGALRLGKEAMSSIEKCKMQHMFLKLVALLYYLAIELHPELLC